MITKSYRGVRTELSNASFSCRLGDNGTVLIAQNGFGWGGGNRVTYGVNIHADELLRTAKTCLKQLSNISGVEYQVAATLRAETVFI